RTPSRSAADWASSCTPSGGCSPTSWPSWPASGSRRSRSTSLCSARQMPTGVGHAYLAQRMRAVRGFARCLHGIDPATEIPPLELLPARRHGPAPHIYTKQQIAALMAAARTLRPALRAATIETVIGLLACPGLRDAEV